MSHADTTATYPSGVACDGQHPGSVSGEAFTAFAQGSLQGVPVATGKIGDAVLPPTGGFDQDTVPANVPGVVVNGTSVNTTSGSLAPTPNSQSSSNVEDVNVLDGLVTADVLDVSCASETDGDADTTFGFTFANLTINGTDVIDITGAEIAPNTTIAIPDPSGDLILLVLNEQTESSMGGDTDGTINAIHLYVLKDSGVVELEVIVASAHCDAHAPAS